MTNLNSSFSLSVSPEVNLLFREQEKVQLLKRLRQSVGPDVPWAGFLHHRGDWSGRGAQPSSPLHVGCPCPKLTSTVT